jgi:hypothetical protein
MNSLPGAAQKPNQWSPAQRIPGYEAETYPPVLIADQDRTVHAFASQQVGEEGKEIAIIYNQWSLAGGWTAPVDVLLSPLKHEARLLDAFLDQAGTFHVVFFGGDETEANIYYAKAPAVGAGRAPAWSAPGMVAAGALNPESGAIAGDDKGNLVILFSGMQDGHGLYVIYSVDKGSTWSDPEPIFRTHDDQLWPYDTRMYLGHSGQLHAVWSVYDIAGHGVSMYYANLRIGQRQWSDPLELAKGVGIGVQAPNVIEYQGDVLVIYYSGNVNSNWLRLSRDGGRTWADPVRIAPRHVGTGGPVSLTVDSNQVLHLLFGERIPGGDGPTIYGIWHTTFRAGRLSKVEAVVSGPLVNDLSGDKSFGPGDARAVVSQGNVLLVTWRQDPGLKGNGVWYSYQVLNAPELPLVPLPTAPVASTAMSIPTDTRHSHTPAPPPSPASIRANQGNIPSGPIRSGPGETTMFGIAPVVLLILVVVVVRHRYSRE